VVDHDVELRMTGEELAQVHEVLRLHERVEAQPPRREGAQRVGELALQHPFVVGDVLDHRPQADELRFARQRFDFRRDGARLEVHPADDAGDARVRARAFEQEVRFADGRRCLHDHGARDAGAREVRLEVTHREVAVQRRQRRGQPSVIAARELPDVVVRVDAFRFFHRGPPSFDAASAGSGSGGSGVPPPASEA
jgi:hypothetical protein